MLINELTYNILETKNKTISGAINEVNAKSSGSELLWEIDPNSPNIIQPKADNSGNTRVITSNNKRIVYIADPEQPQDGVNLRTLNKNIPDLTNYYKKAEITNFINELKHPWKEVGTISDNLTINYNFINNKKYKVTFNFNSINNQSNISLLRLEFLFNNNSDDITIHQQVIEDIETNLLISLVINNTSIKISGNTPKTNYGIITKLEEYLY